MCRTHSTLYTATQMQICLTGWQCTEPLPRKGQKVMVVWGGKPDFDVDLVEVELWPNKGTYGDRLYKATFSSRAGRALDQIVQQAHVVAFAQHLAEERRNANLARHEAITRDLALMV